MGGAAAAVAAAEAADVVSHVVLMKPRPDLPAETRRALIAAFENAARHIPSVRGVRIGRRVLHGAGYERAQRDDADYLAIIDFDDVEGLRAYLSDPAHEPLGRLFGEALAAAAVYDFEMIAMTEL